MSKLKLKTLFTSACLLCLTQFGFNVEAGSRYVLDLPRALVGDGATVEVKGEPAQMLVSGFAGNVRMWCYNGYWSGSQYYRPKDIIFDTLKNQSYDSNHTGSLYFDGYSDNSANFRIYASSDKSNWREVINVGNVKGTSYVTKNITIKPSTLGSFRYIRAKLDSYSNTYNATIDGFRLSVQQVDNGAPYGNAPKIIASDENSFTVEVTGVGDAISGVSMVRFPTWTKANGQDDIQWYAGTNHGNGRWTYTVNRKNHNNEFGEYITHVYAYDADWAGNSKNLGAVTHSFVDSTPPTVSHTISPSGWTNGSVTINITATDSYSGLKNIILPNGSTTTSGTASYTVTSNGTYTFKATDNEGNVNTYNVKITNIDKTAPAITLSQNPTSWTNGSVTVTASVTDADSGVSVKKWAAGNQSASYFASNGTTITGNNFTVTSNGTYTFYAKDAVGNASVKTITISNIDKTAPTITLSQNPTTWTNGNVTITANITEKESGINIRKWAAGSQNASYFASNGTTITSNSFTVSSNGTYTFYVKDNAGNASVKTITISNIDKTAPVITLSQSPTTWTNSSVTITASITEKESGINTRKWASGNQNASYFASNGTTITSNSFTVSSNGTYTFYVKDNAGNTSVKTITISNIDKTAPTITLSQNPTAWTNGNVTITANITENESGVSVKKWASGNQNASYFASNGTTITSNSFTVSSNGTYTFYVKDNAGNTSVKTITISNIDKIASTITGTFDYPWVKGTRTISFTSNDTESGIASLKLWDNAKTKVVKEGTVNGKTASLSHVITEEGVTKYKIESIDMASNVTTKNVTVRIDNTAPEGTISMPTVSDDKTITIFLSNLLDTYSGLKEAIISENSSFSGSNVVKVSLSDVKSVDDVKSTEFTLTGQSTFEENFTTRNVYVRLIDNVGNYKDYTFSVILVPKKPSIPIILTPEKDQLFVSKETVLLTWSYDSRDEDVGYMPQQKAEIELKHIETGATQILVVEGEVFNTELTNLDDGCYEVRVRVYNFDTVYEESEVRTFRINTFKDSGNVLTIDITHGSPIKYVSILTESAIPNGTSIEGKLYYSEKSNGDMDKSKYINFTLTNHHTLSNIITLPKTTGKLRIEYILKGSKSDNTISPVLDHLIVLAK